MFVAKRGSYMEQLPLFLLTIWSAIYLVDASNYLLPTITIDSVWFSEMTWTNRYLPFYTNCLLYVATIRTARV